MVKQQTGPEPGPEGFVREMPVPWQRVYGKRTGWAAQVEAHLAQAALELAARLPERPFQWLVGALARLGKRIDKRHTQAAREFITTALGEMPKAELEGRVLEAYRHFVRVVVEPRRFALRVPTDKILEHYDVIQPEILKKEPGSPGCLLISAHLGHWEGALSTMPALGFSPCYAVIKPPKNRPLSILSQRERESRGINVLRRRGAITDVNTVIKAGGSVVMLLDQRANKRPLMAPFFGRLARCDRSVGVLVKRLRVPVIICACTLTDVPQRYRFEVYEHIQPSDLKGQSALDIVNRINAAYERMILDYPEQYFWLHDRYKSTPQEFAPESPEPEPSA
jgi:KDO2-lipid IV(A) lauroyltransferase